jgi:hypothetical protein
MTRILTSRRGAAGLAFLIVTAGGVAIDAALAEDGGYTAPPKGLQITWMRTVRDGGKVTRDTVIHRITASKGDEVIYKVVETGGDEVRLLRGIFSYAYWRPGEGWAEYKFDKAPIRKLWPLTAGKEANVAMIFGYGVAKTEAAARQKWARSETGIILYKVLRHEKVTVPAGTFDTVVIQRDRRFVKLADKTADSHRRTAWFAPSLGYVVKQVIQYEPGNAKRRTTTIEATKIERPGK